MSASSTSTPTPKTQLEPPKVLATAPVVTSPPKAAVIVDPEAGPPVPSASLLLSQDSSPSPGPEAGESPGRSPSRSPRRIETDPTDLRSSNLQLQIGTSPKRIVVCCDGTWQDGLSSSRDKYTNVLRLSRAVNYLDERYQPPIPQIVFYQSGVGTDPGMLSKVYDGATGATLVDKVEEAYAFIAHNYAPGDEIFLFGFSRGAYTARMIAMFIGEIGVLDRRDMDHFPDIFMKFQELGREPSAKRKAHLEKELIPWRAPMAKGRIRADADGDKFTVKCLGVWDTVGALGLPDELFLFKLGEQSKLFGFRDRHLGAHVERAYQALALNEMRKDFNCTKLEQTDAGARRGQTLKQCWFTGAHTDVGGGYDEHDLADITLAWMVANISDALSVDTQYLHQLIEPSAPWGSQQPHESGKKGVFVLAWKSPRDLPVIPRDPRTQETIHPSVLKQSSLNSDLTALIEKDPDIVCSLLPFEEEVKTRWPFNQNSNNAKAYEEKVRESNVPPERVAQEVVTTSKSWFSRTIMRSFSQKKKPERPSLYGSEKAKSDGVAELEAENRRRSSLWSPISPFNEGKSVIKDKESRR